MPVFKDSENRSYVLLPAGDYVFRVVEMESGIQDKGKTAGSPFWELKLQIEGKDAIVFERLIDHRDTDWKIDTFLKSSGAAPAKGHAFEFDQQAAAAADCLWINPVGLRGWCKLEVDEYTKPGTTTATKKNKVAVFYTDRPKLPRHQEMAPEPVSAPSVEAADEIDIP